MESGFRRLDRSSGGLCLILLLCAFVTVGNAQTPISFLPWATNIARLEQPTFLAADFDNDGRLDLLLHDWREQTQIMTNRGDGTFGRGLPLIRYVGEPSPGQFPSFAVGDWNNDGWVDLLGQTGFLLRTNGGFRLFQQIEYRRLGHRGWIDFDADGDLDAIESTILSPRKFNVWAQTTGGAFALRERTFLDAVGFIKGDFNSDGRMDFLALPSSETNRLIVCLNSGNATWTEREVLLSRKVLAVSHQEHRQQGVSLDYNNDGLTDILMNPLFLLRNTGTGFEVAELGLPVQAWSMLAAGDLNSDGYTDIVVSSDREREAIYLNQGGTNFVLSNFPFDSIERYNVKGAFLADLNGDASLDLLLHTDLSFYVYTNAVPASPAPGSPLSPSAVSKAPQEAIFSWSPPVGAAGLSYNIRIGRTPGGVEVVSPHSDLKSGARRIVEMGNAGQSGQYRINGLMPGTYFWSVQSIDQTHRGSMFTEELSYKNVTAPLLNGLTVTNVTTESARITAQINPGGLATICWIQYGTNLVDQINTVPIIVDGLESFTDLDIALSGLAAQSTYFFSLIASNGLGTTELASGFTTEQFLARFHPTTVTNSGGAQLTFLPGVFAADFNRDGKMDFLANSYPTLGLNVFENAGSAFSALPTLWSNIYGGVRLLDWNDDGVLDIGAVETQDTNSMMRLAIGDGKMGFIETVPDLPRGLTVYWIPPALHDLDLDGLRDLVVAGGYDGELGLFVFWRTSTGYDPRPLRLTKELHHFLIADIDNNGFPDVFANDDVGGWGDFLASNLGNGVFSTTSWNDSEFGVAENVGSVDADQDGMLDLSFYSRWKGGAWLKEETAQSEARLILEGVGMANFEWGDYDLDGAPDFLASRASAQLVVRNLGNNRFREVPLFQTSPRVVPRSHWLDADADGDLDIVVLQTQTNNFYILENRSAHTPFPLQPTQVRSEVQGTGVELKWAAPDESLATAYTYNVRVGTGPGKWDVINPLVVPGSSKLLLASMGNAELRKFALLTNLPAADYYWTVQSVDWAYRSSEFVPEQRFTIDPDLSPLKLDLIFRKGWTLGVTGQRGRAFVIERSNDLEIWHAERTNSLERWHMEFPIAAEEERTFFRMRTHTVN